MLKQCTNISDNNVQCKSEDYFKSVRDSKIDSTTEKSLAYKSYSKSMVSCILIILMKPYIKADYVNR